MSVCLCSEGYSPVTMGSDSVTYVDNMACRLARLMVTQADRLTASSHQTLLTPFALTAGALPALDEELVLALTHLELPLGWTVLGNSSLEGESLPENSGVSSLFLPSSRSSRK